MLQNVTRKLRAKKFLRILLILHVSQREISICAQSTVLLDTTSASEMRRRVALDNSELHCSKTKQFTQQHDLYGMNDKLSIKRLRY